MLDPIRTIEREGGREQATHRAADHVDLLDAQAVGDARQPLPGYAANVAGGERDRVAKPEPGAVGDDNASVDAGRELRPFRAVADATVDKGEEIPADLAERFRPARLEALGNLVAWVGRALGLTGGFSNPKLMEATTQFDAMCEGLAMLERRGAIPQGMEEKIWRDGLHALIAGLRGNAGATAEESAGSRRP